MTYEAFISTVQSRLAPLSPEERQAMTDYYGELFEDYIENGLSEEETAATLLTSLDEALRKNYGFTDTPDPNVKKDSAKGFSGAVPNTHQFLPAGITRIEIDDPSHDIFLLPGGTDTLDLQYDETNAENYVFEQKGDVLYIYFSPKKEEKQRKGHFSFFFLNNTLEKPLQLFFPISGFRPEVSIKTMSGDIHSSVPLGPTNLFTMSGDIIFSSEAETLRIATTSGDIRFEGQSRLLDFKTTSGDIRLSCNSAVSSCLIRSTSGDLIIQKLQAEELDVSTVSGDIYFAQCETATFLAKSISGDIQGSFLQPHNFSAASTSGDISLPASDPSGTPVTLRTVSGDIQIRTKP